MIAIRTLALAALCLVGSKPGLGEPEAPPKSGPFFEEVRIQQLQHTLSVHYQPRSVAFVGVTVVPMPSTVLLPNQVVLVREGRIERLGPAGSVQIPAEALRVDGHGKYLMPGLVDMHVHTVRTNSHMLLNLANGVTSVREMCGFPWMLAQREQVRENRLLAPNMYVASPLLNAAPMGIYGGGTKTPEDGRKAVRDDKRAGYDFIKVHNMLSRDTYAAILDEARQQHIRVVGHIPHDILIAEAVAGGQRTFEHFKGYYLDATLEPSTEDYVAATPTKGVWNCPTLYTRRGGLSGEEIKALSTTEEMRYVSARDRKAWVAAGEYEGAAGQRKVFAMSRDIFRTLLPTGALFLAGTDSGSYANTVEGFALIEELSLMESLGMPPSELLRTATSNAAEAMERSAEFGTVEVGKRADLLLLDRNPLEGVIALRHPTGVMVRGIWLDRSDLDAILKSIETTYQAAGNDASLDTPSDAQLVSLVHDMADLAASGWIFRNHQLDSLATLLRSRKLESSAVRVEAWKRSLAP